MNKFRTGFAATLMLSAAVLFTSCHDHEVIDGFGDVVIEMDNIAGSSSLSFGSKYVTANGDTVQFSTFNYYVSNFVLVNENGTEYVIPRDSSYFLCKHDDPASREITLRNVPAGNYKAVKFIIGVDSLKSVSPAGERLGVLDPTGGASGMYWSWNSGYIFVKVEGTSPQAPQDPNTGERTIEYHTGLFGGKDSPTLNNIRKVEINADEESARVRKDHEAPVFHLYVDILEMFTSPVNINVALNPTSHGGPYSANVANNYADMFSLAHVHNH